MNNYETVFILTPVLSEKQTKEAVDKFKKSFSDFLNLQYFDFLPSMSIGFKYLICESSAIVLIFNLFWLC